MLLQLVKDMVYSFVKLTKNTFVFGVILGLTLFPLTTVYAQTVTTFTTGNTVSVDKFTVLMGNAGSLTVFDITAEIPNYNFNYTPPSLPRFEYCSASCLNDNFGVTVTAGDTYEIDITQVPDGDYLLTQREPNSFTSHFNLFVQIVNNEIGAPFQDQRSFVYIKVINGAIDRYSTEQGAVYTIPERDSADFMNFYRNALNFAPEPLRIDLLGDTEPLEILNAVTTGVQTTSDNVTPLYAILGVPVSFIIGRSLIIFIRSAI